MSMMSLVLYERGLTDGWTCMGSVHGIFPLCWSTIAEVRLPTCISSVKIVFTHVMDFHLLLSRKVGVRSSCRGCIRIPQHADNPFTIVDIHHLVRCRYPSSSAFLLLVTDATILPCTPDQLGTLDTAGSKALSNVFCTKAHYAKVGGIKVNHSNALERELLKVTGWNLCVRSELCNVLELCFCRRAHVLLSASICRIGPR
jgi:hypothetical protein